MEMDHLQVGPFGVKEKPKIAHYVELKFKGDRTEVYANPIKFTIHKGDYLVVEAEKGVDLGIANYIYEKYDTSEECKNILRKPTAEDFKRFKDNQIAEQKALDVCRKKIEKHHLNMKLVDCEFQLDRNKVTFYFTSDKRVDFRQLVKDLAAEYRTRIELRQIGVRDEAKKLGGLGVCGRDLCCSTWLREFQPITVQTAKDQNLPLNPNKLAGVCGRLKCCLMFERDFYNWAIEQFPELAQEIETDKGAGIIQRIDILKEQILVAYSGGEKELLPLAALKQQIYECQLKTECHLGTPEAAEENNEPPTTTTEN